MDQAIEFILMSPIGLAPVLFIGLIYGVNKKAGVIAVLAGALTLFAALILAAAGCVPSIPYSLGGVIGTVIMCAMLGYPIAWAGCITGNWLRKAWVES